jgi:hypothetical protein
VNHAYGAPSPHATPAPLPVAVEHAATPEAPRGYSTYDGFKSFAQKGALSIDDIVKGLTREHTTHVSAVEHATEVAPISHNREPIYENVEAIAPSVAETNEPFEAMTASTDVRGFTIALVEGDRTAVFVGLRQHLRGGGTAEKLISSVVCLLDDVYRARIDGTPADPEIARLTARFSTPVLEKLVTSLTTAIDSSYSVDVTGAKLALTRALATLGA